MPLFTQFLTPLQVVVDVQDFINGGEVNVKVVNEREIVIEGHVEKKEGNTTSTKRFRKRYVLPEDIEVEKVTSVMSSDGVLTITTPKKVSKREYLLGLLVLRTSWHFEKQKIGMARSVNPSTKLQIVKSNLIPSDTDISRKYLDEESNAFFQK